MKFVIHDYHNNNSYPVGSFQGPEGHFFIPHNGYVTNEGITFFMLPKVADLKERTAIIASLHTLLKDRYSQGITAVTCAVSDCVRSEEFEGLFRNIKSLDPAIKTIEIIHEPFGDKAPRRSPHADYSIEGMNEKDLIQSTIIEAVGPTSNDRVMPKEGWEKYRLRLNVLYREALEGKLPPDRPIRRFIGRFLKPR